MTPARWIDSGPWHAVPLIVFLSVVVVLAIACLIGAAWLMSARVRSFLRGVRW